MSETADSRKPFIPTIGVPNSIGAPTTAADQAVAVARDVPALIKQAAAVDPGLADKWLGKALVASKTLYGVPLTLVVSWLATKHGLGWDADTCAEVTGVLVLAATAIFRTVSRHPITGFFTRATVDQAALAASPTPMPSARESPPAAALAPPPESMPAEPAAELPREKVTQ